MKKIFVLFGLVFFLPPQVLGCTIPVFRYALEKWELSDYEILVSHRGPLPADLQRALSKRNKTPSKANVEITLVDLDGKVAPDLSNRLRNAWQREGNNAQGPWMQVRYTAPGASFTAWSGPCTSANLENVLDSPMRRAILAHLTRGDSAVFVLMTSDDAKADQRALAMAWDELRSLEQKIKLPEQSKDGPQIRLPLPLKVSFPLLLLDRKRPEEAGLVRLLLATEPDLDQAKGPILFPIFGRGRVLGTLSDKELNKEQVQQVAKFLCRECSCQVKELNPGVDLLLVADWSNLFERLFEGKEAAPMPAMMPATVSPPAAAVAPAVKTSEPGPVGLKATEILPLEINPRLNKSDQVSEQQSTPVPQENLVGGPSPPCCDVRFCLWIAIGIAGGLVLVTGAWTFYSMRK
jgi:hypothetical protein